MTAPADPPPRSAAGRRRLGIAAIAVLLVVAAVVAVQFVRGSSDSGRPAALGTATPAPKVSPTGQSPSPSAGSAAPSTGYDWNGVAALPHCSASLIRFASSRPSDEGLLLTNGHCTEFGFPAPGQVYLDRPSNQAATVFGASLSAPSAKVLTTRLVYATMTGTDVAIYRLNRTYADLQSAYSIHPLSLATASPAARTPVTVPSGFWKIVYRCAIDRHVSQLREKLWVWTDSLKYSETCRVIHGTSGSPILDDARAIVGINNTANDNGARCTENNPCEVSAAGRVSFAKGWSYGQETYLLNKCAGPGSTIDLAATGCALAR